jgi:hypothetical protein
MSVAGASAIPCYCWCRRVEDRRRRRGEEGIATHPLSTHHIEMRCMLVQVI